MNLTNAQQQYRRGRILQLLAAANDRGCGQPLLRTMIRELGYKAGHDTVAIDVAWLAEQGFVTRERVDEVTFVRITPAGRDVASRDRDVPGIAVLED